MKKEERDIFDELIRSKLQHFEADTTHDDWEAIASRLPERKVIPLRRRWPYWAAAAVVSLLVVSSGIYLSQNKSIDSTIAKQIEQETKTLESQIKEELKETTIIPVSPAEEEQVMIAVAKQPISTFSTSKEKDQKIIQFPAEIIDTDSEKNKESETISVIENNITEETEELYISSDPPTLIDHSGKTPTGKDRTKKTSSRKWSFGAGAGGFTESTGNVVNTYALRSNTYTEDERLLALNALADNGKAPKTNIKHKTPISFGLSVSRHLNDHFSLQTGLTYSMLTSDWETQGSVYNNKTRQRLHFIGIPLSLTYKIAEWNRFQFYASAGVQTEVNVAGQERVKSYFEDKQTGVNTNSVRMKEWQWSANARAGVSYPVIRFVSAFAEVGAAYYFDNGSNIETIYSDKSFNVSPQLGIRFSF